MYCLLHNLDRQRNATQFNNFGVKEAANQIFIENLIINHLLITE